MKKNANKIAMMLIVAMLISYLSYSTPVYAVTADIDGALEYVASLSAQVEDMYSSRMILATAYLADSIEVFDAPGYDKNVINTVRSGQLLFIEGLGIDDTMHVWYYVRYNLAGTSYSGYIDSAYIATSDERFVSFCEENGVSDYEIRERFAPIFNTFFYVENDNSSVSGNDGPSYSEDVLTFPESYRDALQALKNAHPQWIFVKQIIDLNFDTVVANELLNSRSLIDDHVFPAYMTAGKYDDGRWSYATEDILRYYLDPRNGITENGIFQFEQLTFNPTYHTEEALDTMLEGTFMDSSHTAPQSIFTYAQLFYLFGSLETNFVSPFHLAARVLQEQGKNGGSELISGTVPGYEGCYNYFNIGATGTTHEEVVRSGLETAKSRWNTNDTNKAPYYCIEYGANFIASGYINQGQDTLYLQKFCVVETRDGLYNHQYMQNISAPTTEGKSVHDLYASASSLENTFVFKIPVYSTMSSEKAPYPHTDTGYTMTGSLSVTEQTNSTVTITLNAPDAVGYRTPSQSKYSSTNTFTVSTNGTYKYFAKKSDGTVAQISVTVSNIDKTAPSITGLSVNTDAITKENVYLTVTATDNVGVSEYSLNGTSFQSGNVLTIEANGTYTVTVRDAAGNTDTANVDITNIDKTAPVITEIVPSETEITAGDITVSVNATDNVAIALYSADSSNWQESNVFTVHNSGTFTYYVKDTAGNVSNRSILIKNVDREEPVIDSINLSTSLITCDDITVSISASDDQWIEGYSKDQTTWQSSPVFTVTENGTYTFFVKDQAGKINSESITVSNIDRSALYVISISASDLPAGYDGSNAWIDGVEYMTVSANGIITISASDASAKTLTMYRYDSANIPRGMYVWTLNYNTNHYELTPEPGLEDLLTYHGFSIRISGISGIRIKTGINADKRNALTGSGVDGYTLKEYGTIAMMNSNRATLPMIKGGAKTSASMAYGRDATGNLSDFVFETVDNRYRFTTVLVGLPDNRLKTEYAFRGYITLKKNGQDVTLYGPVMKNSIYALARRLIDMGSYQAGSAADVFLRNLIQTADSIE